MSDETGNDAAEQSNDGRLDDEEVARAAQAEAIVSARDGRHEAEEDSLTPESLEEELEGQPTASEESLHEEVLLDEVLADEDGVLEGFDEDEVEWEIDRRAPGYRDGVGDNVRQMERGTIMTEHLTKGVVKVIEVVGVSPDSWSDAARQAVTQASSTIDDIVGLDVVHSTAKVSDGRISEYHVNVKLAFVVHDGTGG